jgi:hypothetical protein
MTIKERIFKYLEENFDGKMLLIVDNKPFLYSNNHDLCDKMVELFEWWAKDNEDENYQDPVKLFDYCLKEHNFGDICELYYHTDLYERGTSGDFILVYPFDD